MKTIKIVSTAWTHRAYLARSYTAAFIAPIISYNDDIQTEYPRFECGWHEQEYSIFAAGYKAGQTDDK